MSSLIPFPTNWSSHPFFLYCYGASVSPPSDTQSTGRSGITFSNSHPASTPQPLPPQLLPLCWTIRPAKEGSFSHFFPWCLQQSLLQCVVQMTNKSFRQHSIQAPLSYCNRKARSRRPDWVWTLNGLPNVGTLTRTFLHIWTRIQQCLKSKWKRQDAARCPCRSC